MHQWWRDVARHRVWAALFGAYWVLAFTLSTWDVLTNRDISRFNIVIQALGPVLASGLVAVLGGRIIIGIACGVVLGILDFQLLVNIFLLHMRQPTMIEMSAEAVLVPSMVFGVIGGVLGLIGTLIGRLFGAIRKRRAAAIEAR